MKFKYCAGEIDRWNILVETKAVLLCIRRDIVSTKKTVSMVLAEKYFHTLGPILYELFASLDY